MDWNSVNGWVHEGGAMLGTKRTLPAKNLEKVAEQLSNHKIQGLAIIGGFEVLILFKSHSFAFLHPHKAILKFILFGNVVF